METDHGRYDGKVPQAITTRHRGPCFPENDGGSSLHESHFDVRDYGWAAN
jgi:hypothetical protein